MSCFSHDVVETEMSPNIATPSFLHIGKAASSFLSDTSVSSRTSLMTWRTPISEAVYLAVTGNRQVYVAAERNSTVCHSVPTTAEL